MSTIDIEPSDASAPAGVPGVPLGPVVLRSGPPRAKRSQRRVWVAVAVVLLAIGFLIYKGVTSAFVYFKTADQALADRASLGNATFRIEGTVVARSRHDNPASGTFSFDIASGPKQVHVESTGAPPQLFGTGVPVVLVGHFIGKTDVFTSDQIVVKHSNEYIAAHPNRVRSKSGAVH